jgi:hypothetical protein
MNISSWCLQLFGNSYMINTILTQLLKLNTLRIDNFLQIDRFNKITSQLRRQLTLKFWIQGSSNKEKSRMWTITFLELMTEDKGQNKRKRYFIHIRIKPHLIYMRLVVNGSNNGLNLSRLKLIYRLLLQDQ